MTSFLKEIIAMGVMQQSGLGKELAFNLDNQLTKYNRVTFLKAVTKVIQNTLPEWYQNG